LGADAPGRVVGLDPEEYEICHLLERGELHRTARRFWITSNQLVPWHGRPVTETIPWGRDAERLLLD